VGSGLSVARRTRGTEEKRSAIPKGAMDAMPFTANSKSLLNTNQPTSPPGNADSYSIVQWNAETFFVTACSCTVSGTVFVCVCVSAAPWCCGAIHLLILFPNGDISVLTTVQQYSRSTAWPWMGGRLVFLSIIWGCRRSGGD
jgi:hypothetical protein